MAGAFSDSIGCLQNEIQRGVSAEEIEGNKNLKRE